MWPNRCSLFIESGRREGGGGEETVESDCALCASKFDSYKILLITIYIAFYSRALPTQHQHRVLLLHLEANICTPGVGCWRWVDYNTHTHTFAAVVRTQEATRRTRRRKRRKKKKKIK